ncbi:type VI secretion system tip protein VgrG [Paraburkholderia bannensis]|nr:type VI secretion system tip protein VgrG [Paraburkholderia bannensis]
MQMSDLTQILGLQNNRLFSVETPLSGLSQLLVTSFGYQEDLSTLFTIELGLTSQDATIELKQLIAKEVSTELTLSDGTTRSFHGYVTRFVHLGSDGGLATYSATLRPWTWMLGRRYDIRIFQEKTSEDILKEVFSQYGSIARYEFRLLKPLKLYSYCTQYRESDLNFVKRLLEHDGLFFYFEHGQDGHTMIITDDSLGAKPIAGESVLRYATGEMFDEDTVVTQFRADRRLESGAVTLKTADYKSPGANRLVSGDTIANQGDTAKYEVYDYLGAHGFDSSDRGEELMRFRLEALEAEGKVFVGASNCRTLASGHTFTLIGHYDHDSGKAEDREFLVLSVSHHGTNNYQATGGSATYGNSFVCIRKKIPFRPSLNTPKPMIAGPQTAIVVGPKGEEIYTDELGRVKVQFHWDRLGQMDHRSSCWVRVGQAWAGSGFGAVQIPRIGDEVVVSFLDGNPDRPLIISRVYNAANAHPWKLPENATQSGILSRSTKGHYATANAIRFEDRQGAEELWLQAEKDMKVVVEDAQTTDVLGGNRTITVAKGDQKTTVSVGNLSDTVTQGNTTHSSPAGIHTIEAKELWIKIGGEGGTKIHMTADAIDIYKGDSVIHLDASNINIQASRTDINPKNG